MAKQPSLSGVMRDALARGHAKPRGSKVMTAARLAELLALAQRIVDSSPSEQAQGFDTERWLRQWLAHPNPALGGARPIDLLVTQDGTQTVRQLLAAMESGAYL